MWTLSSWKVRVSFGVYAGLGLVRGVRNTFITVIVFLFWIMGRVVLGRGGV